MARHVFDTILARGDGLGLKLCGMHALDCCRIEKAYRHFGHDISSEDHVLEAGLGFAVKPDKRAGRFGDFIGRKAVLMKKEKGLTRRLLQFKLGSTRAAALSQRADPARRQDRRPHHAPATTATTSAPRSASATCRSSPGESIEALLASRFEIEIAGERVPATASLEPLYDPRSERMRV